MNPQRSLIGWLLNYSYHPHPFCADGTTADRQMRKKKEMIERAEWAFEDEVEKTQRAWNCFHLCKKQWYTADDYKNIKGSVRFHTGKC